MSRDAVMNRAHIGKRIFLPTALKPDVTFGPPTASKPE